MAAYLSRASRVYLGTMTFGWEQTSSFINDDVASIMCRSAFDAGINTLDSARIYSGGKTEPIVGSCLAAMQPKVLRVTTKAHPSQPGGLTAEGIRAQLSDSLTAFGCSKVDELYLHQPDTEADLFESLEAVNSLVEEGLVGAVGMSNYHVSEVARALDLCAANGWAAPSVYQGLYNPLNRRAEEELLPFLKLNGVKFVAYNALAAGLLTGKHTPPSSAPQSVLPGRFKDNPNYLPRFYTDANFKALSCLDGALLEVKRQEPPLDLVAATYAWLLHHSALGPDDGILMGASSPEQLSANLAALDQADGGKDNTKAPVMDQSLLAAFDEAWRVVRDEGGGGFPYWRSYSRDHPGRESMDPGAGYAAHGPK